MRAYVGLTDWKWFQYLRTLDNLEEVNFWQPSGSRQFRALQPGDLFLFKLHSPRNFIVGGGTFSLSSLIPISLAWDTYREGNGAPSLQELRNRIAEYRHQPGSRMENYTIGCILLLDPFFRLLANSRVDWGFIGRSGQRDLRVWSKPDRS